MGILGERYTDDKFVLFKFTEVMIDFQLVKKWNVAGDFEAFIEQANSTERTIAAQRDVNIVYTFMWDKKYPFVFDDKFAFRNKQGNIIYIKITTEPQANLSFRHENVMQATAEVWVPPAEVKGMVLPI